MMHYKKGKNVEEELTREQIPLENLPQSFLWMHVKGGSRIFGLIDYAKKELESGQYRAMVWSGTGGGVGKTISCAEIMKKDYELHQVTRICYRKVEEFWDPQQEGLEPIVATRNIPSIHILLSLEEIDPKTPGYQHSRARTTFWSEGDQTEGKSGRKNYFTGPQLKKKPNRHYENGGKDGGGTGANGGGPEGGAGGNGGGNKNKKKNKGKGGKPAEGGQTEVKEKKDSGGKAENKAKKAKNNENKQKAQSSGSGDAAPVGKEPAPGTSSESLSHKLYPGILARYVKLSASDLAAAVKAREEKEFSIMKMADGSTILRRNRPGTKAKDFSNWPDEPFEEMDSTLAVQQYIQQMIKKDPSGVEQILTMPDGQDEGVWKYEHLRQFCMELNGLAVRLQTQCFPATCTQMTATEQWIFLCAAHKTPKECPAIDYTRHTLDGAACLLNSNKYFPSRVSIKESSVSKLGSVCRRVYRIFSHAYYHHRRIFNEFEEETYLCLRFTHFVTKYSLMSKENLIVPIPECELTPGESEA